MTGKVSHHVRRGGMNKEERSREDGIGGQERREKICLAAVIK